MTEAQADAPVTKRERSPSFPYLDLDTALEHTQKLFRSAKLSEVRPQDVASVWGMTANSGSFNRYLAATSQFGLLESVGSGEGRRFRVSPSARRIFEDNRPGVREDLLSEAALLPKLIRGLFLGEDGMPCWGADRPHDSIAESTLKFDLSFNADAAKRFLSVYDQTIKHVAVGESGRPNSGDDPSRARAQTAVEETAQQPPPATTARLEPSELPSGELNKITFRSDGAGRVSISATLDSEGLDILAKKIEAFRLLLS